MDTKDQAVPEMITVSTVTEPQPVYDFDQTEDTATEPTTLVSDETKATRTVTRTTLIIKDGELFVHTKQTTYEATAFWSAVLLEHALFYDVREKLNTKPIESFVKFDPFSVTAADGEKEEPARESDVWPIISSVEGTIKGGEKFNRVEKLESLLADIRSLNTQMLSANARLELLRKPSSTPHVETSELTNGSTREQNEQMQLIANLHTRLESKRQAYGKNIEAINAKLGVEDSGWDVPLPPVILEITALNQPYRDDTEADE